MPISRESLTSHLLFPLRGGSILVIIIFALLFSIVRLAGLFGLWLGFVLVVLLSGYAFRLMDSVSEGRKEPPVMGADLISGATETRPVWLGAAVLAGYGVIVVVSYLAPGWENAAALLLFALAPAAIALLGLRHTDPWNVINPVALLLTAREMGWYYFGSLVAIIAALLVRALIGTVTVATPVVLFVELYAMLVVFSVTGGALYARRHVLGTGTVNAPEQVEALRAKDEATVRENFLDEIYRLDRVGRHRDAYQLLRKEVDQQACGLPEQRAILQALGGWENKFVALHFGRDLVSALVAGRHSDAALEVAAQCMAWDSEFRPATAAEAIRLFHQARHHGRAGLARRLLEDFEERYPGDPATEIAISLRDSIPN